MTTGHGQRGQAHQPTGGAGSVGCATASTSSGRITRTGTSCVTDTVDSQVIWNVRQAAPVRLESLMTTAEAASPLFSACARLALLISRPIRFSFRLRMVAV